jgi:hypothetical protein
MLALEIQRPSSGEQNLNGEPSWHGRGSAGPDDRTWQANSIFSTKFKFSFLSLADFLPASRHDRIEHNAGRRVWKVKGSHAPENGG